jgi:membrane peptidoglycan carboxypeptidase
VAPLRSQAAPVRLVLALLASIVAGLLLAGLAFPLLGVGLVAKSSADDFLALPAELETPPVATRSRVLAADGSLLASFYAVNRITVPLSKVPATARNALIAIEDSRFYEHNGVDYKGTLRAALTNARSGRVEQGGSTLTQQYVKNALIEQATDDAGKEAAHTDSLDRKLREARYALALERKIGKDRVLENYLNIAYYGNGTYGIGSASGFYFGLPVNKLSLAQGALLAGMVQNPTRFDPTRKDTSAVKARRDVVLTRMAELGYIDAATAAKAARSPVVVHPNPVGAGCETAAAAPFFCAYVLHELYDTPAGAGLGATREARSKRLLTGGLTVKTTLDPKIQAAAQKAVDSQVPAGDRSGAAAVSDVVEPGTGQIKAMAVDRVYGQKGNKQTKVNLADGGSSGFQAGSTFKPFVLAAAVKQGIPLSMRMFAPQTLCTDFYVLPGGRCPSNAGDSESGFFDVAQATHLSVNTFYIPLEEKTGIQEPAAIANAMGLRQVRDGTGATDQPLPSIYPSFVLGSFEVSPLAMAGAYATFAAHGTFCQPHAVVSITSAAGRPVKVPQSSCSQVLEPNVADTVTSVLRGVIDGPEPGRTGAGASIGRPAAGKTGTTNDSTAAWFVGYTPQLSTAVWVGRTTPSPLRHVTINGRTYRAVFGGTVPAAIWRRTMSAALQDVPVKDFAGAAPYTSTLPTSVVPDVSNLPYIDAVDALRAAGFDPRRGGAVPAAPVPAGLVAYTSPGAGSAAATGRVVLVYVSDGRAKATPKPSAPPAPGPYPTAYPTFGPSPSPTPKITPSGASPTPTKKGKGKK